MQAGEVLASRRAASALPDEDAPGTKRQKISPSARPRASLACHSCRQRKIRCDIQRLPTGSTCSACRISDIDCRVSQFSDRRKHGSREHIAALQEQIRSLDVLIRQIVPDGNTSLGSSQGESAPLLKSPTAAAATTRPSLDDIRGPQDATLIAAQRASSAVVQPSTNSHESPRANQGQQSSAEQPGPADNERQRRSHTPRVHSGVNGEGEVSEESGIYFGPSCQLHVSSPSDVVKSVSGIHAPGTQIDMDSDRLKTLLFNNYCNFQTLSVTIIHPELFLSHRARGLRSQHYSRFLENSMMACSARLSTSVAVRALGSSYAMRAKSEIVSELEDPNVATLQGMLLLSDYEMTEGRDRVGWMYCGIACRLVVDLGLHHAWSKSGDQDASNVHGARFRGSVTLGCFVYETLWSMYLGRPSHIAMLGPSLSSYADHVSDNLTLRAWFDLCVLIAEITTILDKDSLIQAGTLNRLSELDGRLRRWYSSVPADIALDYDNVSALDAVAYGLHMQYLRVQMLLHSLPISSHRKRKQSDGKDQPPVLRNWTAESSRQLVHHNALKIAQLGITYGQIFGVEKTPSVMLDNLYVAATVLISNILGAEHSSIDENDLRWLRLLDEMLKDLQPHFHITARMRRTLARIVEGCPLLAGAFMDDVQTSPVQYGSKHGGLDNAHGGGWGSLEAAVNDFVLDPSLFNLVDFELVGDGGDGVNRG
ncbi:hypothetical protein AYO20_06816 [Fonsecaea nubica]|uniref:Zn(2)-C6 fungal-type domain-containing protein n=1 Tax=Fonsecaea nubica TaxID=856822 RepID=A0A178CYG5_9EURO|nr:hypothetical protein AYO20_06816 [Fonsecaea nubica]OAL33981.1 hypothetical protein AYO20_06816 [Fonsecaea nubica]